MANKWLQRRFVLMDEIELNQVNKSLCGFLISKIECFHFSCHSFEDGNTRSCMLEIAVI